MAYINVAEWTPDQVTDWLKGLDETMYNYIDSLSNNEVGGQQLLNIRPYELEQLGMCSIGHQEIVLEAVENLRNFHFNLDKENLQFMALHVATAAHRLHRQLATNCDASKIETRTLHDITRTVATIKPLIGWLERAPFQGDNQFNEICRRMLRMGLEMATTALRDRFAEGPVEQIRSTAEKMEGLANYIIQEVSDPMVLQPASLNLVTFKKRESELGFNIESSYQGIHRITDIKYNSPAHNSGKIEDGDEIVQINYQTVVGWQYKTVLQQLRESVPDVLLTLKKRPKHTKIYGQIYVQPYRLPSKKRVMATRWGDNAPSPRPIFLKVPDTNAFNMPMTLKEEEKAAAAHSSDSDLSCSDLLTPTDAKSAEKEIRLFYPKPRAMLQRRNTICGDEFLNMKISSGTPLWHERKAGAIGDPASPSLRDKSISFGNGLELTTRHTTCIGLTSKFSGSCSTDLKSVLGGERKQLKPIADVLSECEHTDKSKPGVSKVVRFDANMKYEDYPVDEKYICNVENTILETFEPIPFADEEDEDALEKLRNLTSERAEDILEALDNASKGSTNTLVEAINMPMLTRRGRLDKSHSTPAYDNSGEEDSETPPAIEPRKEFMLVAPPVPPPRPRKRDMQPDAAPPPPPPPKPANLKAHTATPPTPATPQLKSPAEAVYAANERKLPPPLPLPLERLADMPPEANELHTPTKSKTLTLKKKHNLIAKRRNVNLKVLGTGDIQGHLFRRKKDRRGVTYWARLYFVMLDTILYGFQTKEASKASCVIFLPGFTVSLAKEVYSKPFAFKVYHSSKTFYFATESLDALNQWIEFIRQATLQHTHCSPFNELAHKELNSKDLYSENESSEEEHEALIASNLCTPSPQGAKDAASTSAAASSTKGANSGTPVSSKQDRSYFGSLRKLTKNSLHFKSSSAGDKRASSDIPVPTEQYRSYRKVPGGSFGIQIGTNTPGYHDQPSATPTTSPTVSSEAVPATPAPPPPLLQRKPSFSPSCTSALSSTESTSTLCLGPPSSPAPKPSANITASLSGLHDSDSSPTKSIKKLPYNFIHASNPNLVEFDFQTSKTLDYSLPKVNSSNAWDAHHNIQGFVTLKDLMLQKQEEDAKEMYNNRVLLGVEKKDEQKRHLHMRRLEQQRHEAGGKPVSKTQSRSLPKTPDYEISFKPDDEEIKRTRTKEGLKLRDFGYELISGDEPIGASHSNSAAANAHSMSHQSQATRQNSNASAQSSEHGGEQQHGWASALKSRQFLKSQLKQKKHSSNSCSSTSSADLTAATGEKPRTGSFKKKSKLSGERLFHFHHKSGAGGNTGTMTLPLNKKSSHNLETQSASFGIGDSGIKKSITYNHDLKDKAAAKYDAHRKNSAPMPLFGKLSFASATSASSSSGSGGNGCAGGGATTQKNGKEKKLLGSPHLHRAIFGGSQHQMGATILPAGGGSPCTGREYDREIFSQVIFPTERSSTGERYRSQGATSLSNISAVGATTTTTAVATAAIVPAAAGATTPTTPNSNAATPEYPNMECPPVFEPEIYSLTDPQASLSLLIRRNNSSAGAAGAGSNTNTPE